MQLAVYNFHSLSLMSRVLVQHTNLYIVMLINAVWFWASLCLSVYMCAFAAVQCEVCTQRPAACDCQSYDSFGNSWASSSAIIASLPLSARPTSSLSNSCSLLPLFFNTYIDFLIRFVSLFIPLYSLPFFIQLFLAHSICPIPVSLFLILLLAWCLPCSCCSSF